jgi:phosphohistidine swiveling domain-containing protein
MRYQKMKTKRNIIIFALLCIIAIGIGCIAAKWDTFSINKKVIQTVPTNEVIKSYSTTLSYSDLARNPEKYKGTKITAIGTVLQVMENGNKVDLRVAVAGNSDKVIMVTYNIGKDYKRILENDTITIRGVFGGLSTYNTILGAEVTVPVISGDYVTLENKLINP